MESVGFLELNSIAKGVQTADAILKVADVKLIFAKAICPGKYNIMYSGELSEVEAGMCRGEEIAGGMIVDKVIIPRINKEVFEAINQNTYPSGLDAVGVMEFFSITASVYAADKAVKSADVKLVDVRLGLGIGGKSFVVLSGNVSAVEEAVKNGISMAETEGLLVDSVVIPNPKPEIFETLL